MKRHRNGFGWLLAVLFLCVIGNIAVCHASAIEISGDMRDVVLIKADRDYAYVRGIRTEYPGAVKENGTTYLPVRFLAESFLAPVAWNDANQEATVFYLHYEIICKPGADEIIKADYAHDTFDQIALPAPVMMLNEMVYIPAEAFSAATGIAYRTAGENYILFGDGALMEQAALTEETLAGFQPLFEGEFDADAVMKRFYVDPVNGRDSNAGSSDSPLRTIGAAKAIVRQYKAANSMTGNIEVILRGGEYLLDSTIKFDAGDSGENGYRIRYMAYPGETPVINGGEEVHGWELYRDGIYRAYIGTGRKTDILSENGAFCTKARYPNEGYSTAVLGADGLSVNSFGFKGEDVPKVENVNDMVVSVWAGGDEGIHNWFQDYLSAREVDFETHTIRMTGKASENIGPGSRYFLEGCLEFLDSPGEFYVNPEEGYIYYYPINENITEQNIIMPAAGIIFNLGGSNPDKCVSALDFVGLTISNTDRGQNGFTMVNAADIRIEKCHILNIGQKGIFANGDIQDIQVKNCLFEQIGEDAIHFHGTTISAEDVNKYNTVVGNRLDKLGVIYGAANPIWANQSDYNYIANNVVSNSSRFGIEVSGNKVDAAAAMYSTDWLGYTITYDQWPDYVHGKGNVIENNEIYLAYNDSQDCGAIYLWCAGDGNVVRGNQIHDCTVEFSYCFPLYLDDGSDKTIVYDNVVYQNQNRPSEGEINGVFCLKGRDCVAYNNIAVNNQQYDGASQDFRTIMTFPMSITENDRITVKGNIFYNSGERFMAAVRQGFSGNYDFVAELDNPVTTRFKEVDNNMYYNENGNYRPEMGGVDLAGVEGWLNWQGGKYDQHSTFGEDPRFWNVDGGDYRLHYLSPAYGMGFRDIDFASNGLTAEYPFADLNDPLKAVFITDDATGQNSFVSLASGEQTHLSVLLRSEKGYVLPAEQAQIYWSSDNEAAAVVDQYGTVTAMEEGAALITVKAVYHEKEVSSQFYVLSGERTQEVTMSLNAEGYAPGKQKTAVVRAVTSMGRSYVPESRALRFISSDASVASVNAYGTVTGISPGTAEITMEYEKDGQLFTQSQTITVKESLFREAEISLSAKTAKIGEQIQLTIAPQNEAGEAYPVSELSVSITGNPSSLTVTEISPGVYGLAFPEEAVATAEVLIVGDGVTQTETVQFTVLDEDNLDDRWNISFYDSGTKGSVKVSQNGMFRFETNGINIWNQADSASFAYQKVSLDPENPRAEIIAQIDVWPGKTWEDGETCISHMGIMMRDADNAAAKNYSLRYSQEGFLRATWRENTGGESGYAAPPDMMAPLWLRIVRDGNTYTSYYKKTEADSWSLANTKTMEMGTDMYIGLTGYTGDQNRTGGMAGKVIIHTGDEVTSGGTAEAEPVIFEVSDELKNFAPFAEKDTLNVVYLGGSITEGAGASSKENCWASLVTEFFKQAYPDKTIHGINAGVGGTGSDYGLLRLDTDVIAKDPDLVFVEFAVNDTGYDKRAVQRQMEGIVRQLQKMEEPPIIVFLYTTTNQFISYAEIHQEVADFYGIPSINLKAYLRDEVSSGNIKTTDFLTDGVHPNDAGYRLYADFIVDKLNQPEIYLKQSNIRSDSLTDYYDFAARSIAADSGKNMKGWTKLESGAIETNEAGAEVTFSFSGSVFALQGRIGNNKGKMTLSIDGTEYPINNYYATVDNQLVILFKTFDLSSGNHTAKIVTSAGTNGSHNCLDRIFVEK